MNNDRLEAGSALRDLALDAYIRGNPGHDRPEWMALPPFSAEAWAAVHDALLAAGWRPPPYRGAGERIAEAVHRAWGGDYAI